MAASRRPFRAFAPPRVQDPDTQRGFDELVGLLNDALEQIAGTDDIGDERPAASHALLGDRHSGLEAGISWEPEIQVGGSPVASGGYTAREGLYWRFGSLVFVLFYVAHNSVAASGEELQITLPVTAAGDMNRSPVFITQSTVASGDAHGQIRSSESSMYVNEDQRNGTSSWTFSAHAFRLGGAAIVKVDA